MSVVFSLPPLPTPRTKHHMLGKRIQRHGIEKLLIEAHHRITRLKNLFTKRIRDEIKKEPRRKAQEEAGGELRFLSHSLSLLADYLESYEPLAFDYKRRAWVPLTRHHVARRQYLQTQARATFELARRMKNEVTPLDKKPKGAKNKRV